MEIHYGENTLLDYDILMKTKEYGHLCVELNNLKIIKADNLELIDGWNKCIIDFDGFSEKILYITILEIELDYINKNITTLELAIKMKEGEAVDFLDTGDYYLN